MHWLTSPAILVLLFHFGYCARILTFFPFPWRSHNIIYQPLMKALAMKGHEVHYYTAMPVKDPPKGLIQYPVRDVHDEVYFESFDRDEILSATPFKIQQMMAKLNLMVLEKMLTGEKSCQDLFKSNETFDAVITEFPLGAEALAYLAPKFKALSILLVAVLDHPWFNEVSGLSDNPSHMVNTLASYTDRMNFGQRLYNFYSSFSMVISTYLSVVTRQQAIADKYIRYEGWEKRPGLLKVISDNALILLNSHVATSYSYPRAPHVKSIAGIHITPTPEPLTKELQEFMDDAPHGVIYFSMGSMVDPKMLIEIGKYEVFLNVFKSLKQKVLWKVAKDMPSVDDPKIKLQTWFPQQSLLKHKNVALFITHGGMQSLIEAIHTGVPCLSMPVLFDQKKVSAFVESVAIGRQLSFDNTTDETLAWSINEVISNPIYRGNMKKRNALFHDRPMKPVDEAVYWIEYVLRHGRVLQPASVHLPSYQYFMLDVLAVIFLVVLILVYSVKTIVCKLLLYCCNSKERNVKKKVL